MHQLNQRLTHTGVRQAAIAAALFVAGATSAQANLLTNGGFDAQLVGSPNGGGVGFVTFHAPNQGIPAWLLTAGGVDVFTNFLATGNQTIDMTSVHKPAGGAGPGSLQQSFATTVGAIYNVNFLMGGGSNPTIKSMEVAVSGPASAAFSQVFALDGTPGVLLPQQFSFIANATSSTLRFTSLVNDSWDGPLLDTVSVTAAVPEPESWALLLAGLGMLGGLRRRSQAPS